MSPYRAQVRELESQSPVLVQAQDCWCPVRVRVLANPLGGSAMGYRRHHHRRRPKLRSVHSEKSGLLSWFVDCSLAHCHDLHKQRTLVFSGAGRGQNFGCWLVGYPRKTPI